MEGLMIFLQKWRVRLGHLFALVMLAVCKPEIEWLIAGTIVAFAGEAVRMWSAGTIDKNAVLSRGGPYAYMRNPLYFGSFLMYLGFCIASGNFYVLIAYPFFFFPVYYATIFREEAFLREKFTDEFERFVREVPRFFPRPFKSKGATTATFALSQMKHNREYEALIAIVIILGAMWAMALLDFAPLHFFGRILH